MSKVANIEEVSLVASEAFVRIRASTLIAVLVAGSAVGLIYKYETLEGNSAIVSRPTAADTASSCLVNKTISAAFD